MDVPISRIAQLAAGPGRTPKQTGARFHQWIIAGIIPPAAVLSKGQGGEAFLYPQSVGAIAAVLFDLYDAGAVTNHGQLKSMWRYLSEAEDGAEPLITHVLAEIEAGNPCWLVLTLWRHSFSGECQPTCGVRFADETERPFEAPSDHYTPFADYVIHLDRMLARFATRESNIVPLKADA